MLNTTASTQVECAIGQKHFVWCFKNEEKIMSEVRNKKFSPKLMNTDMKEQKHHKRQINWKVNTIARKYVL